MCPYPQSNQNLRDFAIATFGGALATVGQVIVSQSNSEPTLVEAQEGLKDAIDRLIETFPSHSNAPTPNDINNAPGGNSPSVRDQTETVPTGSDPSLDPNNINNPGIPPFVPPDTAHRDPEPPVVTDRFDSRTYTPTAKHEPGGWGTEMDLDRETAERVLNDGILSPNQRQVYGYRNGKVYEFQPDNVGGYHGYPVPGNEVPPPVLRQMRDEGTITNSEYKKLTKGK
jgi:hypothetical protein